MHPDDQAGLSAAITTAILRGGAYAHQYRVRRADGRYYWIEANGRVDRAEDGTPLSFPPASCSTSRSDALPRPR